MENSLEIKEKSVEAMCKAIKEKRILPHFSFLPDLLRADDYQLDNKTCYYYADNVLIGDNEDDEVNLLVDHNGFFSSLGFDDFQFIFNWDSVADVKVNFIEDGLGMILFLFQEDKRFLSIKQTNSKSLLIIKYLYDFILREIIKEFKDESTISWSAVDKMGVKRMTFSTYDELYSFLEIKEPEKIKKNIPVKKKKTEIDSSFEEYYQTSLASKDKDLSELVKEAYLVLRQMNDSVKFSSSAINFFKNSNSDKKYTHYISIGSKLPIKLYIRFFDSSSINKKLITIQKKIKDAKLEIDGQQIIIPLKNIEQFKCIPPAKCILRE